MTDRKKFYVDDEDNITFAGTNSIFHIGDLVSANGKRYLIKNFYRSEFARPNEIDWLELQRSDGLTVWKTFVYPSEAQIVSRPF